MLKSLVSGIKLYLDKRLKEQRDETDERIADQKWHETTATQLFNETVTTENDSNYNVANISYSGQITDDEIVVTFDGVEYRCTKIEGLTDSGYGAPFDMETATYDFTSFPFNIVFGHMGNSIVTETPGEHTVSVTAETITYTDTFKEGVHKNVLKEVDNEDDADIIVINSSDIEIAVTATANCVKFSSNGTPTLYTDTVYFPGPLLYLYRSEDAGFANGSYSYSSNALTKKGLCYYGTGESESEALTQALRITGEVTFEDVSDYAVIKYYSIGLIDAVFGVDGADLPSVDDLDPIS